MILDEKLVRAQSVIQAAQMMMSAARTAPKAKGVDIQEIVTITGEDLILLAGKMRELAEEFGMKFFLRDANGVENCQAVVVVATRLHKHGLNCGYCGFPTCAAKTEAIPCYFNAVDVGIALGSAAAMAADLRVDSRVMYSAGIAAHRLGLIGNSQGAVAIALSSTTKNPFFDRVFEQK